MEPFDPDLPLPGPPEPWASTDMPSRRDGPPSHMADMIRAEPGLARRLLGAQAAPDSPAARLAGLVGVTATAGHPILVVGCGTSEHGALAVAQILRDAARRAGLPSAVGAGGAAIPIQAFEAANALAGSNADGGLVIGITHEGSTWATNRALEAARAAGATVAVITVSEASPAAAMADLVLATRELDQSWCHTIGYVAPILAGAAIGAHLAGETLDAEAAAGLLRAGLDGPAATAIADLAAALADAGQVIVLGSGADRTAARELTLKLEEGTHLPAAMRDLETMLHGHLAGTDERTGLVLILTDADGRGARTARALAVLRACREIGIRVGAIVAEVVAAEIDPALTPAGRITVPDAPSLPSPVAALLASAVPLQALTERLAVIRGVDPDPIRRDDPRYLAAANAVD